MSAERRDDVTGTRPASLEQTEFVLKPLPPFRLDLTAWALRRRPVNSVDRFDGRVYRRVFVLDGWPVGVDVMQRGTPSRPELHVSVLGTGVSGGVKEQARKAITEVLGLQVDLSEFYSVASGDTKLAPLARQFRGVKPPRFPSVFETLVNAIACQQVSLDVGILLLSRLSARFGLPLNRGGQAQRSFPTVRAISRAKPEELRELGFSRQKSEYLLGLARSVSDGSLKLDTISGLPDQDAVDFLMKTKGIGRWSAEYTLLRGLGRLGVFPGDDVGGRNNLQRWLRVRENLDYDKTRALLEKWRGFRGLIYFHLLLKGLDERGYFGPRED